MCMLANSTGEFSHRGNMFWYLPNLNTEYFLGIFWWFSKFLLNWDNINCKEKIIMLIECSRPYDIQHSNSYSATLV